MHSQRVLPILPDRCQCLIVQHVSPVAICAATCPRIRQPAVPVCEMLFRGPGSMTSTLFVLSSLIVLLATFSSCPMQNAVSGKGRHRTAASFAEAVCKLYFEHLHLL